MRKRIYLASPYSDFNPAIRSVRWHLACAATANLLKEGHFVFSPICHSHHLVQHGMPANGFEFWRELDFSFIRQWAECLYVLKLPGWEDSEGVAAEIELAEKLGLPVEYMDMEPAAGQSVKAPSMEPARPEKQAAPEKDSDKAAKSSNHSNQNNQDDSEDNPAPSRKCHDCDKPTNNYRCPQCLKKWRSQYEDGADFEDDDLDLYGF